MKYYFVIIFLVLAGASCTQPNKPVTLPVAVQPVQFVDPKADFTFTIPESFTIESQPAWDLAKSYWAINGNETYEMNGQTAHRLSGSIFIEPKKPHNTLGDCADLQFGFLEPEPNAQSAELVNSKVFLANDRKTTILELLCSGSAVIAWYPGHLPRDVGEFKKISATNLHTITINYMGGRTLDTSEVYDAADVIVKSLLITTSTESRM